MPARGAADHARRSACRATSGALRILLLNTFVIGFYFIPFHVLRMTDRPTTFVALTTSRSAATLLTRFALIIGLDLGVTGFVLADLIVSSVFTVVMLRWFRPLIRLVFSRDVLDEALRFGLPRVPHGLLQQVMFVADRYVLRMFSALSEVGLYQMGASFGMALKLVLNAFEYAWAPFYFQTMKAAGRQGDVPADHDLRHRRPDRCSSPAWPRSAPRSCAACCRRQFHGAARIVPWIGLGVGFHGVYLLTSIGLNITKATRLLSGRDRRGGGDQRRRQPAAGAALRQPRRRVVERRGLRRDGRHRVRAVAARLPDPARMGPAGADRRRRRDRLPGGVGPAGDAAARRRASRAARSSPSCFPRCLAALGFLDARELRTLGRMLERVRAGRAAPAPAAAETDVTLADEQQIP